MGSIKQLRKMGPLEQLMDMIPGMGKLKQQVPEDMMDKQFNRLEAIVSSMTRQERKNPAILNSSRKRRSWRKPTVEFD